MAFMAHVYAIIVNCSMPAPTQRAYSKTSIEAARLLGRLIRLARKERRMPAQELADRLGASRYTVQRLEKGDLKVETGLFFEAATILGVPLFAADVDGIVRERRRAEATIALLPDPPRGRPSTQKGEVDDDF